MSDIGKLLTKALKKAETAVKKADEAIAAVKEASDILKEMMPKDEEDREAK